jgi:hypothetical protein
MKLLWPPPSSSLMRIKILVPRAQIERVVVLARHSVRAPDRRRRSLIRRVATAGGRCPDT